MNKHCYELGILDALQVMDNAFDGALAPREPDAFDAVIAEEVASLHRRIRRRIRRQLLGLEDSEK